MSDHKPSSSDKAPLAVALWVVLLVIGGGALTVYENRPGPVGRTPDLYPSKSQVTLAADKPTLIMLAHPHCACTRASLEELSRLLTSRPNVQTHVLFLRPASFPSEWAHSELWSIAQAIPGVRVREDYQGEEAKRFGAQTSGYVVLYAPSGKILFKGGLTPSRAHAGDSAGRAAMLSILSGEQVANKEAFVFGCPLISPSSNDDSGACE